MSTYIRDADYSAGPSEQGELVNFDLSVEEAFTLAMNLLSGCQSRFTQAADYAAKGITQPRVRHSFVARVTTSPDARTT